MHHFKFCTTLLALVFLVGSVSPVLAQENSTSNGSEQDQQYSDEELRKFLAISNEIKVVRKEKRAKIQAAIKEEGLTMKRYQTIRKRMMGRGKMSRSKDQGNSGKITEKEKQQFKRAQEKVIPLQEEIREMSKSIIEENDFTEQKFRAIAKATQSNRKLQKRLKRLQGSD